MSLLHASAPGYNERAWAIDVISAINLAAAGRTLPVRRAGGERSVSGAGSTLFPDVLLYGDAGSAIVQQGWELKMPDTPINDLALLANAAEKARRLDLNSFVVWNAQEAALHVLDEESNEFRHAHSWPKSRLATRADVASGESVWVQQLATILDDINSFLQKGTLRGASPIAAINEQLFVELLRKYTGAYATSITAHGRGSLAASDAVDEWWDNHKAEYEGCSPEEALARVNIVNWVNRFLFAHYLKNHASAAFAVESITETTSPENASDIFVEISRQCDFMNVFKPIPSQRHVDKDTWRELVALNRLLTDSNLNTLPRQAFTEVLEKTLAYSRKKLAGQFATPRPLAELLVALTVEKAEKHVIDPCCGTGTIARAAFDYKVAKGLSAGDAMATVWGSDKFAFPLQLCTIALSDPRAMWDIVRVFQHDALTLVPAEQLKFTDPNGDGEVEQPLPTMHAVVSNLPFVRFEDYKRMNPLPQSIREASAEAEEALGGKSDLYAYLVLQLATLLEEKGRIGVIISNSWLGTQWGAQFRRLLMKKFKLLHVVQSGAGRWFDNAAVVTTVLVLEKRAANDSVVTPVRFAATLRDIREWDSLDGGAKRLARAIRSGNSDLVRCTVYDPADFPFYESYGLTWTAFFADVSWLKLVAPHLISLGGLFKIRRGERRGCNDLFYPEEPHGIEADYLVPLLKSPKDVITYDATPPRVAFACSASSAELSAKGHSGALAWIRRFETATNEQGVPWPKKLQKASHQWYELKPSLEPGLLVATHPNKRLSVSRLATGAVVDQCFIPMTPKPDQSVDVELCHALLNSTLGLFMLEAAGFGRGQGSLDLNGAKLTGLQVLNPVVLDKETRNRIVAAFEPVRLRAVLDVESELAAADRHSFDQEVLNAYGLLHQMGAVREALLYLYRMRLSVRP